MSFFSPLDLLMCGADEQDVLRFLMRKPNSCEKEIADQTRLSIKQVKKTLTGLIEEGRVTLQKDQDRETYNVLLRLDRPQQKTNGSTSLLDSLFD